MNVNIKRTLLIFLLFAITLTPTSANTYLDQLTKARADTLYCQADGSNCGTAANTFIIDSTNCFSDTCVVNATNADGDYIIKYTNAGIKFLWRSEP